MFALKKNKSGRGVRDSILAMVNKGLSVQKTFEQRSKRNEG